MIDIKLIREWQSAQFRCDGVHEQASAAFQDEPLFRGNVRQAQFPVLFQQRTGFRKDAFHILRQIKVRIVALLIIYSADVNQGSLNEASICSWDSFRESMNLATSRAD